MFKLIPAKEKKKLRNVTLLFIYSIFAIFFLINGGGLFSEWDASWTVTTLIYLVSVCTFLVVSEKLPKKEEDYIDKQFEQPISKSIIGFCFTFPIVTILFILIKDSGLYFQNLAPMPLYLITATIIYQLVIVVSSEEIIFRGVIFRWLYRFHWIIAWVGSAALFALFHIAVYGGSVSNLFIAFLMGIVLAWAVDRWNLGVAISIHFAWNIFLLVIGGYI